MLFIVSPFRMKVRPVALFSLGQPEGFFRSPIHFLVRGIVISPILPYKIA